ncbi:MAG: anti-virulence regulator CigR family protein, partial [Elioraea tepidiphila]
GIARNLARGKPLPPGIAKRYAPAGLLRQIVPRPGYEILVVGASILLVHAATGIVHDILSDVIRGR